MSIKRLALCRSQGRLFVLLRFAGKDVAEIIECEGSRAFAHATDQRCQRHRWRSRSIMDVRCILCPSVAGYERELAVLVLPFLDGSAIDVDFASGGPKAWIHSPR